jgi:hypothetical protein
VNRSTTHFYIYYRVAPTHAVRARQAVAAMMLELERRTGIAGKLLRGAEDHLLWMEIYEGVRDPASFAAAIQELLKRAEFEGLLAEGSSRATERFVASDA